MSGFPGSAPWGWARCRSAPQARNFAGKGTSYAEIIAEMAGKHDDNGPLPLSLIQRPTGVSWYLGCLLSAALFPIPLALGSASQSFFQSRLREMGRP